MAGTKIQKQNTATNETRDTLNPGELFVRTTYIRLCKQKYGIPESEASNLLDAELKLGSVAISHDWGGIKIYKKGIAHKSL